MLTTNRVRVRVDKKQQRPRFVEVADRRVLEMADALSGPFAPRGAREREPGCDRRRGAGLSGGMVDHELMKGLAMTQLDRATLATSTSLDPVALRAEVFAAAALAGPARARRGRHTRGVAADRATVRRRAMASAPLRARRPSSTRRRRRP